MESHTDIMSLIQHNMFNLFTGFSISQFVRLVTATENGTEGTEFRNRLYAPDFIKSGF